MARIAVLGGGVCGLAGGMLLARDGHEVTVLERDGSLPPPSEQEAWDWLRDGVTQFRQAHFLQPAGRVVLEEELPEAFAALVSAGAKRLDVLGLMPPTIERVEREGDERFVTFTARRPTIERALAGAAEAQDGLEVRRGVTITEPTIAQADGAPRVTGVMLDTGESLTADLVVDAMGRASQMPRWLSEAGIGPIHEESEDSGFIYYSRFFKSADGSTPQIFGPLLCAIGTFSLLTLPSDNGTWSVTLYVSSGDKLLKAMRDAERWMSVVGACPAHAHWLEGEPISDVIAMGGIVDRHRRLGGDGRPALTGLALLGDAWACTNPSLGRGMALGLKHARCLRDVVAQHIDDPVDFAQAWDAATERELMPWYRSTVEEDRNRLREIMALREGRDPEPATGQSALREATIAAMFGDADIFRTFLDDRSSFTPLSESLQRDGMAQRVVELAAHNETFAPPGPGREELLALLA